jgi:hypothetical protein
MYGRLQRNIYVIAGGPIESYLKGTLTFSDLWRSSDGQRFVGYNMFLLASTKWFSSNYKILALMIPFFILCAALLIYREYKKSLLPERSPEFIAGTFFILSFIIFNVIQWESLVFGYALAYQSSMPFFLISFVTLELFLSRGGGKYFASALISSAWAILVFSGKLYIVFAPALLCTFLCYVLTKQVSFTKDFRLRVLLITLLLSIIAFIYSYRIQYNDYVSEPVFYGAEIFAHPLKAAQFLLASFGSSVVGIDVFFTASYFSFNTVVILGCFVLVFYVTALVLFFRANMYEKTYLPFFLMMLTLFYLVFMTFRRFGLGMDYGMASRFAYISLFGLAAVSWIFIYTLSGRNRPKKLVKTFIFTGFSMILAGLLLTSMIVWRIQPERKAYFMKLNDIAMHVDTATDEDLLHISVWPEQVRYALKLLREHNLNVYRKQQAMGK